MTDTTDAVIGAVGGLLAIGIMANVASKMIKGPKAIKKQNSLSIKKSKKLKW